jgi:pSer/pThr/pTyr-binding forkhead associated (FHA) protein
MKSAPVIIVQLIHIEGPLKGQIQDFSEPEISIGRHPACNVQFPKDLVTVSRRHASIVREGNRFKLINYGANGTLVNGKRVEEEYLNDGDVLTIAEGGPKVSFLTEIKEGEYIPSPPARERPEHQPSPPPKRPEIPLEPPAGYKPLDQIAQPQPYKPISQYNAPGPRVQHKSSPPIQQEPAARHEQRPAAPFQQPRPGIGHDIAIQKVSVPLIIQLGPTLRSFKELPVTVGRRHGCDLVLEHPEILDLHAQFFFSQDRYWIKDLTGRQTVSINGQTINVQAPLNTNDHLALTASGPRLRFLGGGRLAEIEGQYQGGHDQENNANARGMVSRSPKYQPDKAVKGPKSVLDKFFQRKK